MPEPACLHIQGRESDQARVVDLPGVTVRVGRGPFCEVRLADPELPAEICRLRRAGQQWQLVPSGNMNGRMTLDGAPISGPSPLNFDQPVQFDGFTLTLRPSETAPVGWGATPYSVPESRTRVEPIDASPQSIGPMDGDAIRAHQDRTAAFRSAWRDRPAAAAAEPWQPSRPEAKRWESRWRAVGEKVRASQAGAPKVPPTEARRYPSVGADRPATPSPKRVEIDSTRVIPSSPAPAPAARVISPPKSLQPVEQTDVKVEAAESGFSWSSDTVTDLVARIEEAAKLDPELVGMLGSVVELPSEAPEAELGEVDSSGEEPEEPAVVEGPGDPSGSLDLDSGGASEVFGETPLGASSPDSLELVEPSIEVDRVEARNEPNAPIRRLGAARRVSRGESTVPRITADETRSATPTIEFLEPPPPPPPWFRGRKQLASVAVEDRPAIDAKLVRDQAVEATEEHDAGPAPAGGFEEDSVTLKEAPPKGDWPTVADILAAQPAKPAPGRDREAPRTPSATPGAVTATPALTIAQEPGQWSAPVWLVWFPAAALVLGSTVALGGLGLLWARDSYHAGVVASRLEQANPGRKPLPEGVAPGRSSWWATTGSHLLEWAAYLDRSATDPSQMDESRELLARSVEVSPLQPGARLTMARPLPVEPATPTMLRALGQPQDVAALAWSGRKFLELGQREPALKAFKAALRMASAVDPTRGPQRPPLFLDDPEIQRYALPGEDQIALVVRVLASQELLTYQEWSKAVPAGTAAPVVVARILRQLSHPDAKPALDEVLADATRPPRMAEAEGAVSLAIQAEALALNDQWAEAEARYRLAIDLMPVDMIRRAWWLNVADLNLRLNEEPKRLKALELAKSDDLRDEITQRAVALQKASGLDGRTAPLRTARAGETTH